MWRLAAMCAVCLALNACTLWERPCSAPILHPKSLPAQVGVSYTPTCQGYLLDFDAQLWLTSNNEDAERLCRPGDSVKLVDPSHVIYTGADGSAIKVGSPTREHRLGCA
jgi:hypothetical protein